MIEAISEHDDALDAQIHRRASRFQNDEIRAGHPQGPTIALQIFPVILRNGFSRTKASRRCWTRWWTTCPPRWTCRLSKAWDVDDPEKDPDPPTRSDAEPFSRTGFQDHDRPVRRATGILSVFYSGSMKSGWFGVQCGQAPQRTRWTPASACMPINAKRFKRFLPATSVAACRPERRFRRGDTILRR